MSNECGRCFRIKGSPLGVILVVLSGMAALWFGGKAANALWKYSRLNASVPASITQWSVKELSSSAFVIEGNYFFELRGKRWEGAAALSGHTYPNPYAAEREIPALNTHAWHVWYDAKDPATNALQKFFPFQAVIHALITLGVSLYFVCLRGFLRRFT